MKVDTFIIGAPKSGTTALASYLANHPNICFAKGKETWFFMGDCYQAWKAPQVVTTDDFHSYFFPHYDASIHRAVIEATPLHLYAKNALESILNYNRKARFIVMLRDPIEMLQSLHAQLLWDLNSENVADLEKAWNLQNERMQGRSIPRGCKEPLQFQYAEICAIGDQCEHLIELVPREQILFLFHKDLKADTKSIYQRTLDFLKLPDDQRIQFDIINERKARKSKIAGKLISFLLDQKRKHAKNLRFGIAEKLIEANQTKSSGSPISLAFCTRLQTHFDPQVDKIEKITGVRLMECSIK